MQTKTAAKTVKFAHARDALCLRSISKPLRWIMEVLSCFGYTHGSLRGLATESRRNPPLSAVGQSHPLLIAVVLEFMVPNSALQVTLM